MHLKLCFVGEAETVAGIDNVNDGPGFIVNDLTSGASVLVVPNIGDKVLLRTRNGTSIRHFRCTGRSFDFSEPSEPTLEVHLDLL